MVSHAVGFTSRMASWCSRWGSSSLQWPKPDADMLPKMKLVSSLQWILFRFQTMTNRSLTLNLQLTMVIYETLRFILWGRWCQGRPWVTSNLGTCIFRKGSIFGPSFSPCRPTRSMGSRRQQVLIQKDLWMGLQAHASFHTCTCRLWSGIGCV